VKKIQNEAKVTEEQHIETEMKQRNRTSEAKMRQDKVKQKNRTAS